MITERRRVEGVSLDPTTGRGIVDGYEAVDLKLPSGTLWATCNVGATSESGYGNYYMYGKGSTVYNRRDSAYTGTENPLSSSVDTASVVMGGGWRMPTHDDAIALIRSGYTEQANWSINGVYGSKFYNPRDNNRYLFIPYGGYYNNGSPDMNGHIYYLWTASPEVTRPGTISTTTAYKMSGATSSVGSGTRTWGMNIRAVHDPI